MLCSFRGCGLPHGHAGPCDGAALGEIADVVSPDSAPRCTREGGCTYSKAMSQPYPRCCTICGNPEIASPLDGKTHAELAALGQEETKAQAHAELEAATIQLRDASVLLRKSQQRYKDALDAFNRAVAPEVKG